jgi:copper oxidase (laccase) domain-containing protein
MIVSHQPTLFGSSVIAAISSRQNGNMKFGLGDDEKTQQDRLSFLSDVGIDIAQTTLVGITYATDDFTKYRTVEADDKGRGMTSGEALERADALVTNTPDHALFLPLADCVGAILYDEDAHVLMVSHLGRHSIEQEGALKSVQYLVDHFGVDSARLKVWLSPGVGKESYPLHNFEGKGLHEVIEAQLARAGVIETNIENACIDTAKDVQYFSHSEYLKGNETDSGRFAIVAMMTTQGEPAS